MLPLPPLLLGDLVDERVHALEETPHRYSTARTPEPLQESLLELSLCQPLLVLPDEVPHELRGGSKAPLLRAVPHVVKEFLGHRDVEGLHTSPDTTRQRISPLYAVRFRRWRLPARRGPPPTTLRDSGTPSVRSSFVRSVPNRHQGEAVRGRRRAGPGAVASREQLAEARRRPRAPSHLDQRADDVPHHVLQERGRLDTIDEDRPGVHAALEHAPHGRAHRLRVCAAEGGEVVLADERGGGLVHGARVEGLGDVPGVPAPEG